MHSESARQMRRLSRWLRTGARICRSKSDQRNETISNGYVPMHPVLAQYLKEWRTQSRGKNEIVDSVFGRANPRIEAMG